MALRCTFASGGSGTVTARLTREALGRLLAAGWMCCVREVDRLRAESRIQVVTVTGSTPSIAVANRRCSAARMCVMVHSPVPYIVMKWIAAALFSSPLPTQHLFWGHRNGRRTTGLRDRYLRPISMQINARRARRPLAFRLFENDESQESFIPVGAVPTAWSEVRQDPCSAPHWRRAWELKKRCEPKTE